MYRVLWAGNVAAWQAPEHVLSQMPDGRLLDISGPRWEEEVIRPYADCVLRGLTVFGLERLHLRGARGPWAECLLPPNMRAARATAAALLRSLRTQ